MASSLRRDLKLSATDCFLYNIMVGAGETFLPAFALAMGTSEVTAGLIASIPFLAGSTLQLATPRMIEKFNSYRRWVVLLAVLQAICFMPLVALAIRGGRVSDLVLFAIVTIYWACSLAASPAWNAWMSTVVPTTLRPRYFASRSHMGQLGLLVGLICGGGILHLAKQKGFEHEAFAGLFLLSAGFRLGSAFCLRKQSEDRSHLKSHRRLSLWECVQTLRSGAESQTIRFLLCVTVAVQFASPFFTPFMLKKLELSYGAYMVMVAGSFLAKIFTFRTLSRAARNMDPYQLIRIGLIGAGLAPALWLVSDDFGYLLFTQVVGGACWALYDLGVMLVLFGAIRDEIRTSILSFYNFASALMIFIGSGLGGKVLSYFGESTQTYYALFAATTCLRLMCFFVFPKTSTAQQTQQASQPEALKSAS